HFSVGNSVLRRRCRGVSCPSAARNRIAPHAFHGKAQRALQSNHAFSSGRLCCEPKMKAWRALLDWSLGPCVRRIPPRPGESRALYLTFDDGPFPPCTEEVLAVLAALEAKATFFLIAERAESHPSLVKRLLDEGHAIGNHSLDHRYQPFFSS